MGSAKSMFFEVERAPQLPSFIAAAAPVRSYSGRQELLAAIRSSLELLRWEVSEISGATDSVSGDYSPACDAVLRRVDAIELQIKKL